MELETVVSEGTYKRYTCLIRSGYQTFLNPWHTRQITNAHGIAYVEEKNKYFRVLLRFNIRTYATETNIAAFRRQVQAVSLIYSVF